jgi:hypothetical protein
VLFELSANIVVFVQLLVVLLCCLAGDLERVKVAYFWIECCFLWYRFAFLKIVHICLRATPRPKLLIVWH